MKITHSQLVKLDACGDQRWCFRQTFGQSACVTVRNAQKAARAKFDYTWAAQRLLNPEQYRRYCYIRPALRGREGYCYDDFQIGWAAWVGAALNLGIKPTGRGFNALSKPPSFWRALFSPNYCHGEPRNENDDHTQRTCQPTIAVQRAAPSKKDGRNGDPTSY